MKFLITATLLSFTPWEDLLSLEFRSNFLSMLMGGSLGLCCLFFFLTCNMLYLLRLNKWHSVLAILVIPPISIMLGLLFIISLFGPARWRDVNIYQSGDRYLILQGIVYGRDGIENHYRLIETQSASNIIRRVKIRKQENLDLTVFEAKQISFLGSTWVRKNDKEE